MRRRELLELLIASSMTPLVGGCRSAPSESGQNGAPPMVEPNAKRTMPTIFLAHGSPYLLDDAKWVSELAEWAKALPRPKAILMISAHWLDAPVTLAATRTVPLVYDFYGFPKKYYDVTYSAPGAPELAARVRTLLSGVGPVADSPDRGLDHGAYIPLIAMYPKADVPVLQMSIPTEDPATLVALGQKLAPLRDEGVLIVGSGFLTHNMRMLDFGPSPRVPAWAKEFDEWTRDVLQNRNADELVAYRQRAPGVNTALPTHEHFVPVLVTLGSSLDRSDPVTFPITGFTYGGFTKRSLQLG